MQEYSNKAERDKALVGILTRFADEMQVQDNMLSDIIKRQDEMIKALELKENYVLRRHEEVEAAQNKLYELFSRYRSDMISIDESQGKLLESFSRYRSDMLKLVNEQDTINRNIDDLQSALKTATFTIDNTSGMIKTLDERFSHHEVSTSEQAEDSVKQQIVMKDALKETSRDFKKLHSETEKRIHEFRRETETQLNNFQHETTRRLLLLDNIIVSLETLLVRTDPDMKKRPLVVRVFERISRFFRFKLPFLIETKIQEIKYKSRKK